MNTPLKAEARRQRKKQANKTFESFYKVKIFPINARAFYLLILSAHQNFQNKRIIKSLDPFDFEAFASPLRVTLP
ncbi:hypothetical protein B7991_06625 [Fibrobacter sp. UWB3]|nr:hypothetical protein B7991_06625 [Fibrobacter sp. UWB3]